MSREGEPPSPEQIRRDYWDARRQWVEADHHLYYQTEEEAAASFSPRISEYQSLYPVSACAWCGAQVPEVCRCVTTARD